MKKKRRSDLANIHQEPPRYFSYKDYMRQVYGERVQKLTIDAGFTCPNRDGVKAYGGCTYCNNESFSPFHKEGMTITEQINKGKEKILPRYPGVKKYLAYFQSYSNTYASLDHLKKLYGEALKDPEVVGLSIGTRPDCIDTEKLDYLEELAQTHDITIEYGLESIKNDTLDAINRGHSFEEFLQAVELTKGRGIKMCTHIILGLPFEWETRDLWIETAKTLSSLPINFLKLHQLHVVKGTKMAHDYLKRPFKTFDRDEYIDILVDVVEYLRKDIVIQRLFGEAPKDIMVSEHYPESLSMLTTLFVKRLKERNTYQGRLLDIGEGAHLSVDRIDNGLPVMI